jgi:hypothetical protein
MVPWRQAPAGHPDPDVDGVHDIDGVGVGRSSSSGDPMEAMMTEAERAAFVAGGGM